jgi:hypothetical protein
VREGHAAFGRREAGRVLALAGGETLPSDVPVSRALTYQIRSTIDAEPDAPLRAIHDEMRLVEEQVARELADAPDTLVIQDGPLTFSDEVRGLAVGYVKRVLRIYLPASHLGHLVTLPPGQRTPLFALRGSRRFARYAWFVRLAAPRIGDSELSGIVRCEIADRVGVDVARRMADATALLLPPYAGVRGLHARAPQNLLPIAALETRLRRELGDPALVLRSIQDLIAREAAHA